MPPPSLPHMENGSDQDGPNHPTTPTESNPKVDNPASDGTVDDVKLSRLERFKKYVRENKVSICIRLIIYISIITLFVLFGCGMKFNMMCGGEYGSGCKIVKCWGGKCTFTYTDKKPTFNVTDYEAKKKAYHETKNKG